MSEVSLARLYLLRGIYLLFAVGLGSAIWPEIVNHPLAAHGIATSLLAGLSALWALGIRYPLKMLPLLLFELVWKSIWLIAFALPLWSAQQMDADTWRSVKTFLGSLIVVSIAMPWAYVVTNYVTNRGDRWTFRAAEGRAIE